MTKDIDTILANVDRCLKGFDKKAFLTAHRKSGKREINKELPGSNHQAIPLLALADEMWDWCANLPIIKETEADFTIAASLVIDRFSKRKHVEFRLTLMELNVTRPASPRLRTATEMMMGARDRLSEVAQNCASEARHTGRWFIDGQGRGNLFLRARSSREAAWTYAALFVRYRKEVRNWKDTVHEISLLTEVAHPSDWILHSPDAHHHI